MIRVGELQPARFVRCVTEVWVNMKRLFLADFVEKLPGTVSPAYY
jgi:hypothetical protein